MTDEQQPAEETSRPVEEETAPETGELMPERERESGPAEDTAGAPEAESSAEVTASEPAGGEEQESIPAQQPADADSPETGELSGQAEGAADGQSEPAGADDTPTGVAVPENLKSILESALFAAGEPLTLDQLSKLFEEEEQPARATLRQALAELRSDYEGRGVSLVEVASGFRFQIGKPMAPWVSRLWEEKPQRYSRAFLETLALIAYRQPITRAEIEEVRGVSVSSNIIKGLTERGWVRIVGHRDVPGKPAIYATTRQFLDYFGLASLDELPPLSELKDIDKINEELDLTDPDGGAPGDEPSVPAVPIPAADIEPFII